MEADQRWPARLGSGRPLRWLLRGIEWAVIAVMAVLLTACVLVPRIAGAEPYVVLTSSMEPELPPGTLVIVRPVDPGELHTGEVVTYQLHSGEPTTVTHRVVGIGSDLTGALRFQTKGDANQSPDPELVRPVQIKGTVWYHVPYVGRAFVKVSSGERRLVEDVAVAALLAYAAWMFVTARRDRRSGRSGAGTNDGDESTDDEEKGGDHDEEDARPLVGGGRGLGDRAPVRRRRAGDRRLR